VSLDLLIQSILMSSPLGYLYFFEQYELTLPTPQKMKRWTIAFAALVAFGLVAPSIIDVASAAEKIYTIALIPGLTTDPFYITMHKGAEAAAKALGVDSSFRALPILIP
jgi:hypothetical protein